MRITRFLLFAAMAAIGLTACSGPRPDLQRDVPSAFPEHSVQQIVANVARAADSLRSFEARAQMEIESPQRNGRFSAALRQRRGDSLYMSIQAALGIEVARALVTPDSFFVYDRVNRRLTYGALADASSQLPAALTRGRIFENLTGLVVPEPDVDWTRTVDGTRYVLRSADGTRTYEVDPAVWRVTRRVEQAPDGTLIEERRFGAFDTFEGLVLPREVRLRRPGDDAQASIYYRSLTPNARNLSFGLDVPASAKRVLVSSR